MNRENIVCKRNNSNKNIFIIYDDFSKESLLVNNLSKEIIGLNYNSIIIPTSKLNKFNEYYKKKQYNIIISLGNSIYKLNSIINYKYKFLFIDTPDKDGRLYRKLNSKKTIFLTDLNSMKNMNDLINNNDFNIILKKDKYAWLLTLPNIFKEISKVKNQGSKLNFKQISNRIEFNKKINNKLVILFTRGRVLFKVCNKICTIPKGYYVKSVYIPINSNFDVKKNYRKLSIEIKKIFSLIKMKKYLDAYLFMKENKNKFNLMIFKKIFAFISKPLYKIEPNLEIQGF